LCFSLFHRSPFSFFTHIFFGYIVFFPPPVILKERIANMGDGKSKTLHKITRWGSASNSGSSTRTGGGAHAAGNQPLTLVEPLDPEDLKQGQLYIVKISLVKLALFEGMFWFTCCLVNKLYCTRL
jgi:hypothetical protein